jgi:hypothetical protein
MTRVRLHPCSSALILVAAVCFTVLVDTAYAEPTSASTVSKPTVKRTTFAVPHGQVVSASATCPSGSFATGGGVGGPGDHVEESGPVNSSGSFAGTTTGTHPVEWFVTVRNEGDSDIQAEYMWVICQHYGSSAPVSKPTVKRFTFGVPGGGQDASAFARCPTGSYATGGGVGGNSDAWVEQSGPVTPANSFQKTTTGTHPVEWLATVKNVSSLDDHREYVWVICQHYGSSAPVSKPFVKQARDAMAPATFASTLADCPSGSYATGGGVGADSYSSVISVAESGPLKSFGSFDSTTTGTHPIAWIAKVSDNSFFFSPDYVYVLAICQRHA